MRLSFFILEYIIIINCFTVQQNKWGTGDDEPRTSEVLTSASNMCILTTSRYPKLTNGWRKRYPSTK